MQSECIEYPLGAIWSLLTWSGQLRSYPHPRWIKSWERKRGQSMQIGFTVIHRVSTKLSTGRMANFLLELFKRVAERRVYFHLILNRLVGMDDRAVIAPPKM